MNTVERRAEQAGTQLRHAAQQRAEAMDDPSSLARRAAQRGRLQAATAAAFVLLVVVAVGSMLSRPGVVIDPVTREVTTWTGASVELPDGWQVGSGTLMPNGPAEQFVASTAPLPVGGDTCAQVPEAAMEQVGSEDALVSVQQLHPAEPSEPVLGAIEDWPDEHRDQTSIRDCPDNGDELELYWFHAQLDGTGYWVLAAFGSQASEERKGEALSILNSFRPAADGPQGTGEVVVPDVRGLKLSEAQEQLEAVGLVGATMAGPDWQDPTGPGAIVVAQKPGAGQAAERGAAVGFRTAVVSEPLCRVMTRIPPRQGDAHDLAATDGYWTMLEDARPIATGKLADAIVQLLEHRETGQPVADAPGLTLDVVTIHHDGCHLLANEPDVRPIDVPSWVLIRVLAVRPSGPPGLAIIDLERGEVTTKLSVAHDLPGDAIRGASLLTDGTVVVWQNGTIRTLTSGSSNRPPLDHTPEQLINRPGAAPSIRVVPSFDETALWAVQIGAGCCPEPVPSRAELIDLETGTVLLTAELPAASFPIATTPHGLVLNTLEYVDTGDGWTAEPGSHESFLLDDNGTVTDLAPGEAIAASGNNVAVLTCDDHDRRLGCELDLVDVTTGDTRRVNPPEDGTWTSATAPQIPTDTAPWKATAPDGRILAGLATPTRSHLVSIDSTDATAAVLVQFDGSLPPAAWDRDGHRIVVAVGSDLMVHNPNDGESFTVRDVIPPDHYVLGFG